MHIRASSDNPRKNLACDPGISSINAGCGDTEWNRQRSAQDVQMNLDALIALKTKMNGDVNWNDVAPETDGLDHLKQKHKADREREALRRSY
jgi:hypothetical protein